MKTVKQDELSAFRLLRLADVRRLTTFSKPQIQLMVQRGELPAPLQISGKRIAWLESEIVGWLKKRQRASAPVWAVRQEEVRAEA